MNARLLPPPLTGAQAPTGGFTSLDIGHLTSASQGNIFLLCVCQLGGERGETHGMMVRRWRWMALGMVGAAITASLIVDRKLLQWKRFEQVSSGVLYRSGSLHPWQLRSAGAQFGIKTVFSFTFTDHSTEVEICRQLGIKRHFCYLTGDGVGPDDPYLRFLEVMHDPKNHPVLVHCSAGVQRTGGAVALYRLLFQDWEFDAAIAEMIAVGNDGNNRQVDQLRRIYDRYRPPAIASNHLDGGAP